MAKFRCERYPQLRIGSAVRFEDGVCETTDKDALAQLRAFADKEEYGISEDKSSSKPAPAKSPTGDKK